MEITIIKESPRGAKFITDGVRSTWIQGRWMRPDGTLTPRGQEALDNAMTNKEIELREKAREEARANSKALETRWHKEGAKEIEVVGETEKAWKIWLGNYSYMYGKRVRSYDYWAKSVVSIGKYTKTEEDETSNSTRTMVGEVTAPHWWFWQNSGIFDFWTTEVEKALCEDVAVAVVSNS